MNGYLYKQKEKKGFSLFSNHVLRCFILDEDKEIFGYTTDVLKDTSRCFPISYLVSVDGNPKFAKKAPKKAQYGFMVEMLSKTFYLFAYTESEKQMWIAAIQKVIEKNKVKHKTVHDEYKGIKPV